MVAGFSVTGGGKRLLIRAVGPGLVPFGIVDAMPDPVLSIQRGATVIATNDDWDPLLAAAQPSLGGAARLSLGSRDAALVAVLPAGNYTAEVNASAGVPGVVLMEIFELP